MPSSSTLTVSAQIYAKISSELIMIAHGTDLIPNVSTVITTIVIA